MVFASTVIGMDIMLAAPRSLARWHVRRPPRLGRDVAYPEQGAGAGGVDARPFALVVLHLVEVACQSLLAAAAFGPPVSKDVNEAPSACGSA